MSDIGSDLDARAVDRSQARANSAVSRWLWLLWAFVLAMVVVGGLTRLTGSGLSMVDWHPLMGVLPPLSAQDWQAVFTRYQESPQYQLVNHWMSVEDFKRIFLWEFGHRLLGRLIGVVFAVPFLYFLVRGYLRGKDLWRVGIAFVLGGGQGLLGWYMVKSGLVDRPEVSHLRLAAHLSLAFAVGMYLLWHALRFGDQARDLSAASLVRAEHGGSTLPLLAVWLLLPLLALQIVYGAFMAGTHAGLLFPTFPDMNGTLTPGAFFKFPTLAGNLLDNPMAIHWVHRTLGWLVAAVVLAVVAFTLKQCRQSDVRLLSIGLAATTLLQIALGAYTVMRAVPLWSAAAHQTCAYVLLSNTVWLTYRLVQIAAATRHVPEKASRPAMMQV